jgi:hypothetical protein
MCIIVRALYWCNTLMVVEKFSGITIASTNKKNENTETKTLFLFLTVFVLRWMKESIESIICLCLIY